MVSEEQGNIIFNWILRYGALAVMAIWLFLLNTKVSFIENKLYDCLETKRVVKDGSYKKGNNNNNNKRPKEILVTKAVRPNDIDFYNERRDKENN